MNDESAVDDDYEPDDIDPDEPIAALPDHSIDPPVEADPADWLDQHRAISDNDDDDDR